MKYYNFHPFLFASAPILALYAYNYDLVRPYYLIAPLAISLAAAALFSGLFKLLTGHSEKAALLTSLFLFLFFIYGHLLNYIPTFVSKDFVIRNYLVLGIGLVIVYAFVGGWLLVRHRELVNVTKYVFATAAVLTLIPVGQIGWAAVTEKDIARHQPASDTILTNAADAKPDVYYLIFDGYGRQDVLNDVYHYDNEPFISFLEKQGFYVAKSGRTNYPQTMLSLASSLNMDYLDALPETLGPESDDRKPLVEMVENNKVKQNFENLGYQYVERTPEIAGLDQLDQNAISLGRRLTLNEFDRVLLCTTPVGLFFNVAFGIEKYREDLLTSLAQLPSIADDPRPTFAFIHIMVAHPPFVFDQFGQADLVPGKFTGTDGSHYFKEHPDRADYRRRYVNQMTFLNTRIEQMITKLLAKSESPPVIILQGDHGPGSGLNWEDPEKTNVRERLSIFNAYYLPEAGRPALYESITPVNSFRIVFNTLFNSGLPLLEDKSYFATWSHPYEFIDMTDRLAKSS